MAFDVEWDKTGEKFYETGVDRGMYYPQNSDGTYGDGVVWNGLTSVQVQPTGGEANPQYADNRKYLNLFSLEENGATIEAFQFPDEFLPSNGYAAIATNSIMYASAQNRQPFGFSWRSRVGADTGDEIGYKIHILYGCKASPSEMQYQTVNESPEPGTMSWAVTTTPPSLSGVTGITSGLKDTSYFVTDTREDTGTGKPMIAWLEQKLYGTPADSTAQPAVTEVKPALPTIAELIEHMKSAG